MPPTICLTLKIIQGKLAQSTKAHNSWNIFQNLFKSKSDHFLITTNLFIKLWGSSANSYWDILLTREMPEFTKGHYSCPEALGPSNFLLTYFFFFFFFFFSWRIHIWNFKTLAYIVLMLWFAQESNNIKLPEISNKNFMTLVEKIFRWSPPRSQSVFQISRL